VPQQRQNRYAGINAALACEFRAKMTETEIGSMDSTSCSMMCLWLSSLWVGLLHKPIGRLQD
jgi:hypothetical protein